SDSVADGACANEFVITRTWTLVDDCGNTTTADQTITVVDTTAPTFTVPADITIECDQDETDLGLTGDVTDEADNCSTGLEATYTDSVADGACANESVITRTWTLVDDCGNTTTADQTITVVDTTAPTFTVPEDVTIECNENETDLGLTGDVTDEADNCSTGLEATFSDTIVNGECLNEYIITRTWTLVDDCGNTTTADQTITVVDTTAPTFTVPESITIECDQDEVDLNLTGDVTDEADNCSIDLQATFTDSIAEGECANEIIITRTWTLVDDCGNSTTADQTITVVDTTAPVFSELPEDITAECDDIPEAVTLTATDNCGDATVEFNEEITDGACTGEFVITRTWTATDSCNNESIHIQIVSVFDTTAPNVVGEFEDEITVACDDIPEAPELVFEDACSDNITVEYEESSTYDPDSTDDYEIIRDWIVTDECGNTAVYTQTITVLQGPDIDGNDITLCPEELINLDLFDFISGNPDMDGQWIISGSNDAGIVLNGSVVEVVMGDLVSGTYVFTYIDADDTCRAEADVIINIDDTDNCSGVLCIDEDTIIISKAVTANGDQWNEYFEITVIGGADFQAVCDITVELQIFNRWGAKIYENNDYQNEWNGFVHSSSLGSAGQVPTGTYYYIVNLKGSGLKPMAGPIYVGTK
ncbi:MAG: gliding motility-associated C-terminal domain-containing protein, partial [Flavobacteriaceae bacterium]|nr:gliding motility-associated C-terminal domain-containing protein [Flavobacteriaceae bacterium]